MEISTSTMRLIGGELVQELGCSEAAAQKLVSVILNCAGQAAAAEVQKQEARKNQSKVMAVRKILRNYQLIKASVACAVDNTIDILDSTEIQRLMQREENVKNQQVTALALQSGKSEVLLAQIDAALKTLKKLSETSQQPGRRRWFEIIHSKYIAGEPIEETLPRLCIERTIYYQNLHEAESTLALLIFGANAAQEEAELTA